MIMVVALFLISMCLLNWQTRSEALISDGTFCRNCTADLCFFSYIKESSVLFCCLRVPALQFHPGAMIPTNRATFTCSLVYQLIRSDAIVHSNYNAKSTPQASGGHFAREL
jgi:hypothetical protein